MKYLIDDDKLAELRELIIETCLDAVRWDENIDVGVLNLRVSRLLKGTEVEGIDPL